MIQTISLSDDLAERIADYVLQKAGENPFETAKAQIILPTRRACRTVKEAFLRRSLKKSLLLPQLTPLYELDDLATDIPPAMPALERTLLLSKLCVKKPNITTPDQAIKIALSLGALLDEFYQFETDTSKLQDLVPDPVFAEHWNETIVFLDIITRMWPRVLSERQQIDEVDRRIRMINAYTERLKNQHPSLLIAAGLDGGLPAVRRLMRVIDSLRNGMIWMDGADISLSEENFRTLPQHHYQNSIRQILEAVGQTPKDIHFVSNRITARENLIVEALKPESRTEEWRGADLLPNCLDGVTRIDCDTVNEEALTIALLLRGALEEPGKTAALVTPDRNLARRVILEMKRWGVTLDDSAGTPLPQTDIGIYLRLLAMVGVNGGKASDILALLKHPLSADGHNPVSFRQSVRSAEKKARRDKEPFQIDLKTDLSVFTDLFRNNNILTPFGTLLKAHLTVAEALGTSADRTGTERLWSDEAGSAAFEFLTTLLENADLIGDIEPAFYPEILNMLLNSISVRPLYGMHPRLDILGPIEARFHHPDICIIGGLNEGTFPGIPETGPWLNRPMRRILGLPPIESKTASLSMDFAHCFCSPRVYLTRARKSDGAETIPSRFLSRLSAVLQGCGIQEKVLSATWSKELDAPLSTDIICRPAPRPPVEARPKALSVTRIELWMRNPYAIYARYILGLFPLNPLENDQKQQIYGSAVHQVLEQFIRKNPNNCDKQELIRLARNIFKEKGLTETDMAFYLPRFEQTADFIIERQEETNGQIKKSLPEQGGCITFDVAGKPFTLTGTADRIDILKNGTLRLIDYKTGSVPTLSEVESGYAPQLPLEACLIAKGGVEGLTPRPFSQIAYWKLSAQKEKCQVTDLLLQKNKSANDIIQESFEGLKTLIHVFNQPETPYEPCPVPGKAPEYNDYEHLSRSAEWMHEEGGEE